MATSTLSRIMPEAYVSRQLRRAAIAEQLVGFQAAHRIRTIGAVASVAQHVVVTVAQAEADLVRTVPTADHYLHNITQIAALAINQRLAELTYG